MFGLFCFVLAVLAAPFKSKSRLEVENAALRHQLIVLRRNVQGRVRLTNNDRWFFIQLYCWFPSILKVLTIVQPKTLVRWHRAGFRLYWRWKSRQRGGRPQIETDLRALIRRMSIENPLWGAPRIHGELLKLGFEIAQSSVAKYMVKRGGPPSQGWRTFLRNHAPEVAAMDLFVVPTIGFDLLYAFVIVRLGRRGLVWINVTTNPTAEWIARLCVPKTSSKTPELAGIRWLAWRRLVCSSSPSATTPSRTALSRDFVARKREEFAASWVRPLHLGTWLAPKSVL